MDSRRFQRWRSSWYKLHYVNGIIWDSRKFYPSKLHTYINKFWKLQGTISVIQFLQNKFTLCSEVLSNHYLELVCSWFIHGFSDFSIMVRYDWELNYYYQEDPLCKRFNFLCAQILFVLTFLHQMFQKAVSLAGELISVGTIFFENLSSMTDVHLHESFEVSSSNCTSCLEWKYSSISMLSGMTCQVMKCENHRELVLQMSSCMML